jgi:hypothetical protein
LLVPGFETASSETGTVSKTRAKNGTDWNCGVWRMYRDIAGAFPAVRKSMIATPKDWCPNPATPSCLRVRGNSMSPLIQDGCIVAVDSSQNDQIQLNGKIVIAWHKDRGLTVSRLGRFDHTEVLWWIAKLGKRASLALLPLVVRASSIVQHHLTS